MDTEIADLIENPEDLEEEILESEELQCTIAEQIILPSENIPRDLTDTTVGRANGTKHAIPQWNHRNTTLTVCYEEKRTTLQCSSRITAATICRIRKQFSIARSSAGYKRGEYEFKFKYSSKC